MLQSYAGLRFDLAMEQYTLLCVFIKENSLVRRWHQLDSGEKELPLNLIFMCDNFPEADLVSNSKELHVFEVSKDNFFPDFLSSFTQFV